MNKNSKIYVAGHNELVGFLWSEEPADACVFVMENDSFTDLSQNKSEIRNTHINIGIGEEISIKDLAELEKNTIGFSGELYLNIFKPDGALRKLTDPIKLQKFGWNHKVDINEGG